MKQKRPESQTIEHLLQELNEEFHYIKKSNLNAVINKFRKKKMITEQKDWGKSEFTEQDMHVISDYYRKRNYHLDSKYIKENYFTFKEAETLLINTPYTKSVILGLTDDKASLGILKYKNVELIPKKLVFEFQQNGDISDYIRPVALARKMNIDSYLVEKRIKKGFFKDVKKIAGVNYISIKEAEKWISELASPIKDYNQRDAHQEIEDYLNNLTKRIPHHSHTLFVTWITSKISKSHGRASTIKHISLFGIELYELLLQHLPDGVEIYNLDNKIVESLVTFHTKVRLKKEFVLFYNYSLTSTFAIPDKQLRIERPSRDKKAKHSQSQIKMIYHPETYQKYYTHVQDIETHTKMAISNRSYANMWLYVIMHLTNVWRANDIIYEMPHISIENVGISDFQWFEDNSLNTTQAQIIANEVYIHFQNIIANKNLNLLRFYLDPTLLLCFSTAIVICELHCRLPSKSFRIHREELLGTFISGKKGIHLFRSGLYTHKKFFGNYEELKNFSSIAMNRSTMVYFFHNTIEGNDGDSDVALELTKMVRSHTENNTTAIYVESSNHDGAINRVSMNLFSRGHFGWLYNYMINILMSAKFQSLEERTMEIIKIRNEFSPLQIESWSEYLINKNKKDNKVIIQLSKLSEEELINLLSKIFKGKMPAKHIEGQCLTYPTCETPYQSSCFGCSFFIPQEFILFEAIEELRRRVPILQNAILESVVIRESKFINSILLLLSEAVQYLGNDKLNSFIPKAELNEMIYTISDKLLISEGGNSRNEN